MEKQFIDEVEIKGVTYDICDTNARETKADKATTLKGYGITDAYNKTEIDSELSKKADKEEVNAEVARIVSNTPADFDTLKEISDWITEHKDSAAAMNSEIKGKADKSHIHDDRYYTESEIDIKLSEISDIIPSNASASNKLATTDSTLKTIQLNGSVDCNTLTEPGLYTARAGAVSVLTGAPTDLSSAEQLSVGFSVLVTATNTEGTFFGSQMFIPYGPDLPFIRKAYYFNGQYWTDWKELVTMDNLPTAGVGKGHKQARYSFW